MKYLIAITILLSVFGSVYAQNGTDSLYFFQQAAKEVRLVQQNATLLNGSKLQKFGFAGLSYRSTTGHFRKSQEAGSEQVTGIYTEGINTLGKFKVSGYFSFSRIYQDSLAWSSKGTEIDEQPFYFGTKKAGKFERTTYDLGGVLSYSLLKEKLYLAMGADLNYRSSTRSIDPRPKVENYKLILKPELVYQSADHYAGLQASWGYGIEDYVLSYKDQEYTNGVYYPDWVNYMMYGYGFVDNAQDNQKITRRADYTGLALHYSGHFQKYNIRAKLDYAHMEENTKQGSANSVNDASIGIFKLKDLKATALISKIGKQIAQQLSIFGVSSIGYDRSAKFGKTNYHYSHQSVDVAYLMRLNPNIKVSPEFGVYETYDRVEKKDVVTSILARNASLESGITGTLYLSFPNTDRFSFSAIGGYRFVGSHVLNIPESEKVNVFVKGVIYGNYIYDTSNTVRLSGKLNYMSSRIFESFKSGFTVQANYLKSLANEIAFPDATFTPNNYRLQLNVSLNLYF